MCMVHVLFSCYTYIYIHIYMCVCICIYVCVCMCRCVCVCVIADLPATEFIALTKVETGAAFAEVLVAAGCRDLNRYGAWTLKDKQIHICNMKPSKITTTSMIKVLNKVLGVNGGVFNTYCYNVGSSATTWTYQCGYFCAKLVSLS